MGKPIAKRLKRLARQRALVRVRRRIGRRTCDDHGFVLAVGKRLVLLACEDEFAFGGFVVLRLRDIRAVRRSDGERLHERWMREAGWDAAQLPVPPIDLTDSRALLQSLEPSGFLVIVECERPKRARFDLGRIERVGRHAARIRYLTWTATWRKRMPKFRLKHVTRVRFLDRYTRMFARHAPPVAD